MKERNLAGLREAIRKVEDRKFVTRLKEEVQEAKSLLRSLERVENLKQIVLKMDKQCMAEIRGYASPPDLVHEVMVAALLLLGDSEKLTRVRHCGGNRWDVFDTTLNTRNVFL